MGEFQHGQLVGLKEVFNHAHSSLWNMIERCFGVLKMKWRILLNVPSYPMQKQTEIIVATMALHNFIRDSAIADAHFDNYVDVAVEAQGSQPYTEDASASVDETNMGAVRDSIAVALLS